MKIGEMDVSTVTILFVLGISATFVHGTHFQGGTISWEPVPGNANQIKLTYSMGFVHTYSTIEHQPCTQAAKDSRTSRLKTTGDMFCEGCNPTNGRDRKIIDMKWHCDDFNEDGNWAIGGDTLLYTVPTGMSTFVVSWKSCCWIKPLTSPKAEDLGWKMMTEVNLAPRPDNHEINSSPVTSPIPVQLFHSGCTYHLEIPVTDPDNDDIECRKPDPPHECRSEDKTFCGKNPHVTIHKNCTVVFDGVSIQEGDEYYAVRVMIEDLRNGIVLSKVSLSFLLQISDDSTTCDTPSILSPPSVCKTIAVGQPFEVTVVAEAASAALPIERIETKKPYGMTDDPNLHSVPGNSLGKSISLSWTPTKNDIGRRHPVGFNAVDKKGFTSGWSHMYLYVADTKPLRPLPDESSPSEGEEIKSGKRWVVKYNRDVQRPTQSAFIKILDNAGTVVDKLDSSKPNQVEFSGRVIKFSPVPNQGVLSGNQYRLVIGEGVAVEKQEDCIIDSIPDSWEVSVQAVEDPGILPTPPTKPNPVFHCTSGNVDITPPGGIEDGDRCFVHFDEANVAVTQTSISVPYKVCCPATCAEWSITNNMSP